MVKKITSLILSVLLVMGSISVVSAENLVMEDKFNLVSEDKDFIMHYKDVAEGTKFYESIEYVYLKGGISDAEFFRPNDYILRAEVFTILEKMFGNPENLPKDWKDWEGSSKYKSTWEFDRTLIKDDYYSVCSKNLAAHLVLSILDIDYLRNIEFLGFEDNRFNINYYNTLLVYGIADNVVGYDKIWTGITRAEFCRLIHYLSERKNDLKLPFDIFEETGCKISFERFNESDNLDNYKCSIMNDMSKIPKNIIEKFNKQGYKIRVFPDKYKGSYSFTDEVAGMYLDNSREIRLVDYGVDSLVHEIGHYIGFYKNSYVTGLLKFKKTEEYDKLHKVVGRSYYTTSNHEYFAEVFDAYINYSERFIEYCPLTYEYIDNIVKTF